MCTAHHEPSLKELFGLDFELNCRKMSGNRVSSSRIEETTTGRSKFDYRDRNLKDRGCNVELLCAHADGLARAGQLKDAFDVLAAALAYEDVTKDFWRNFARNLADSWMSSSPKPFSERIKADPLSCPKCGGILCEPVTLKCGHSLCKRCLGNTDNMTCVKCGKKTLSSQISLKPNVLVSMLVEKWWSDEKKAIGLRTLGNQLYQDNNLEDAISKYSEAQQLAPRDFTVLSNRSNVYLKAGQSEEALRDADEAVRIRPDWPKGYYRRSMALIGLGRFDEALVALLQSVALENTLQVDVRDDIVKVLLKVFAPVTNSRRRRPSSPQQRFHGQTSRRRLDPNVQFSDESSSSAGEDMSEAQTVRNLERLSGTIKKNPRLHKLADRLNAEFEKFKRLEFEPKLRPVESALVDKSDFECTLCCRLLWQPVTTPCGHTYCRTCLDRCLDHNPTCPLCKTSLQDYLAERRQDMTEFVEVVMSKYMPGDYEERSRLHEEEMSELASTNQVPIFVCTVSFPGVRCPLHVFEPRYRLMIRRAMESGTREFGMCGYVEDQPGGFGSYGTMLEVQDIQYFPDGRSVVDTVGSRRFRVLRRGLRDGYNVAGVEFVTDTPIAAERLPTVTSLNNAVRSSAETWLNEMAPPMRQRILSHFGSLPATETDWATLPNGPAWLWWLLAILPLETKAQLAILAMTSLERRLEAAQRVLEYVRRKTT